MAVALVIAVLLRTFVVATYSIPSGSMEPTLQIGDRIIVDKLSYHLHGVETGNIIVFATPPNEDCAGPPVANLVKRVIGLPGQTISLSGGQVYVDGKLLAEPWLPPSVRDETYPGPSSQPYALHQPFRIPTGDVYVMGDNRPRLVRQPLLGTSARVDHRRQGRPADLAAVAARSVLRLRAQEKAIRRGLHGR